MAVIDHEKILREITLLVTEDLKMVSYKWVARNYDIPANLAKQLLFKLVESQRGKLQATYLLAGWTEGAQGSRQHTVQVVDASVLAREKARFSPITGLHVYSLQPSQPKDPSEVWSSELDQTRELFAAMLRPAEEGGTGNVLADNRCSAVACPAAKRDKDLVRRLAAAVKAAEPPAPPAAARPPAKAAASAPPQGIKKQSNGLIAQIEALAAGVQPAPVKTDAKGPSEALQAKAKGPGPATENHAGTANGATKGPSGGPKASVNKKASGENRMAAMWSKAPPKKQSVPPPADAKPSAAAAEPSSRDVSSVGVAKPSAASGKASAGHNSKKRPASLELSSSDSEEEEVMVLPTAVGGGNQPAIEDLTDDDDDFAPALKRSSRGPAKGKESAAGTKRGHVLMSSDDEGPLDAASPPGMAPAKKRKSGAKKTAASSQREASVASEAMEVDEEGGEGQSAQEKVPKTSGRSKKGPHLGHVKLQSNAGTPEEGQKETRTYINDDGEEITEVVFVEKTGAIKSENLATNRGSGQGGSSHQEASKASRTPAKATGPAVGSGKAAPSGRAGNKSGKQDRGQKGIMSFFAKK